MEWTDAGAGYYAAKSGGEELGNNAGLGAVYHVSNAVAVGIGLDYHNIPEGVDVFELEPPPSDENIQFTVAHAWVIISF